MSERDLLGVTKVEAPLNALGFREPLRIPGGFSAGEAGSPYEHVPLGVALLWHIYDNDFDSMAGINADATDSVDWDLHLTEGGAGEGAIALTDGDNGLLLLTNDAADNDCIFLQKKGESFRFVAGKRLFFYARFKVSDATQSDFVMGLVITDSTPLDVTDGVFFMKDDGDALLDFNVEKDNTATAVAGVHTVVSDTFLEVAFFYDGKSGIEYFVNGVKKGTAALTNLPDDEDLAVTFGIQNGEAVAKTMTLDRILVAKER